MIKDKKYSTIDHKSDNSFGLTVILFNYRINLRGAI